MPTQHKALRGFTLIELLVALSVMAVIALMSWRGLEGMVRTQTQVRQHADEVLALQSGLSQWRQDLESLASLPQTPALDWNGRTLRLTRRGAATSADAPVIVAWTLRTDGTGQWLRWQSPPLRTRGDWQDAWAQAAQWAQNPSDAARQREVAVASALDWQVLYFRQNAWTNPQSSAATAPQADPNAATDTTVPEGVRLILTLVPGQALSGRLTLDWVRPTLGGGRG